MMYSFLRRIKLYKSISEKKIIQIHLHLYTLLLFFFPFNLLTFDPTLQWSRSKARTYMYVARGSAHQDGLKDIPCTPLVYICIVVLITRSKTQRFQLSIGLMVKVKTGGGGCRVICLYVFGFNFFLTQKNFLCNWTETKLKLGAGQGHREWLQCPRIYHPCMVDLNMSDKPTVTWLR